MKSPCRGTGRIWRVIAGCPSDGRRAPRKPVFAAFVTPRHSILSSPDKPEFVIQMKEGHRQYANDNIMMPFINDAGAAIGRRCACWRQFAR